jgi:cyanophycinase
MRRALAGLALVVGMGGCGGADGGADGAPDGGDRDAARDSAGDVRPEPPAGLDRWLVGGEGDAEAATVAGLILMGGGADVDAAFEWQRDRIGGGDVVVLRASGADGYNEYLYEDIGGVDSVETLLVDSRALAAEPYVRWALDHAEAIFLAGGDQSVYLDAWRDTPVADALAGAWARGAVVGGTSAGCAVLGAIVYSAAEGTVYSDEALADPYNEYMTLERDFVAFPPLAGVVTDTHFAARDRMGRLLAFAARAITDAWTASPLGLGIDEATALVVDETGLATVLGEGAVYLLAPETPPADCSPAAPLLWSDVPLHALHATETVSLPDGATEVPSTPLSAAAGILTPADPY